MAHRGPKQRKPKSGANVAVSVQVNDPRTWDLNKAVFDGNDTLKALIEALRRGGARTIEVGYRETPHGKEPRPKEETIWYCQVVLIEAHPLRVDLGQTRKLTGEWFANRAPDYKTHGEAMHEAIAEVIRALGGKVTIISESEHSKAGSGE